MYRYLKKYSRFILLLLLNNLLIIKSISAADTKELYREKVYLQVGGTLYVIGESVHFQAFCNAFAGTECNVLSKVLYVELVDAGNKHISGQILHLSNGLANASIHIPDTLTTGVYQLKAYTNWMRNFNIADFYSKSIVIFNPFDNIDKETTLRIPLDELPANAVSDSEKYILPEENILNLRGLKSLYQPREKVHLQLGLTEGITDDSAVVSVNITKVNSDLKRVNSINNYEVADSKDLRESIYSIFNHEFVVEAQKKELNLLEFQYPVEDRGILYTGKLLKSANQESAATTEFLIAFLDTIPNLQNILTDGSGKFAFLMDREEEQRAFFFIENKPIASNSGYDIYIDSKFHFEGTPASKVITQQPDSILIEKLNDEALRVKINRIFDRNGQSGFKNDMQVESNIRAFYGQPEEVLLLDDFFEMSDFGEISKEILSKVRFYSHKETCRMEFYDALNAVWIENPLVLLNGVPISDPCRIKNLGTKDLDRLEMQFSKKIAGNLMYYGLVSAFSNSATRTRLGNEDMTEYSVIQGYQPLYVNYSVSPVPDSIAKDSRPFFYTQQYWEPQISLGTHSSKEISFFTSDEEANYIIDIQGKTNNGKPIVKRVFYSVVLNSANLKGVNSQQTVNRNE